VGGTAGATGSRGRMRAADAATLAAVAGVVLLVSLPRLRDFALRENESDARQLARRLVHLIEDPALDALADGTPSAGELLSAHPQLERELSDLEVLEGGRKLRRHGYLFELVPTAPGAPPTVRAWPWKHGRTGRRAYLAVPGRGLYAHANPDGRWTGEHPPPPSPAEAAWAPERR